MFLLLLCVLGIAAPIERPTDAPVLVARDVGIGLIPGDKGEIEAVREDTPAWTQGLRPEHRLLRIDGKPTRRMSAFEMAGRLPRVVGQSTVLVVKDDTDERTLTLAAVEFDPQNRTVFSDNDTVDGVLWCTTGDCKNGVGKANHTTGAQYVGRFKDGLYEGYGIQDDEPGTRFEGGFRQGLRDGPGVLTITDEVAYAGTWERGLASGEFTVEWDEDGSYIGSIRALAPHGSGTRVWPDGRRYVGDFDYGDFHGQGELTARDGERFEGAFQNNLAHGEGRLELPRGDTLEGTFLKGKLNGTGVRSWADDGRTYAGEFANNDPHGKGVLTWTQDDVHTGTFSEGEVLGWGTRQWPDNHRATGDWASENRGLVHLCDAAGDVVYEGWLVFGRYEGWGRKKKKDGSWKQPRWYFNNRNYSQHPRSKEVGKDEKIAFDAMKWGESNACE